MTVVGDGLGPGTSNVSKPAQQDLILADGTEVRFNLSWDSNLRTVSATVITLPVTATQPGSGPQHHTETWVGRQTTLSLNPEAHSKPR